MGAVLTGLPLAEVRALVAAWWFGRRAFGGPGRQKSDRMMRNAPSVAAPEQGSVLCGTRLRRTLACGKLEA